VTNPVVTDVRSPAVANPSDATVVRNDDAARYELLIEGEVRGVAEFHLEGDDRVVFTHTEMDRALRGQGYSPVLVARALDDVRAAGRTAVSRCSYVTEFHHEHPEYSDLFAR
jgi:predicted GNAT family acetyltransferase